jgi:hypothetical protein
MTVTLRNMQLPRIPDGPVTGEIMREYFDQYQKYILAKIDIRSSKTDFANGIVATQAIPTGRTVGLPTLVAKIGNTGSMADQRFLSPIVVANRNSVQSSSTILSSSAVGTVASIAVAAHTVKYDFGTVSYNSGTISSLTTSTTYYVYTDDPNFTGGSVTYLASTDPTVMIAAGRYYVGSITTAVSTTAGNVSGATSANPIEITMTAAHGWSSGNTVTFASLPGTFGTNLNGNNYVITVTTTTKFTIAVDGTAYAAYTSGGTATRVSSGTTGGGGAGAGGNGSFWR